MSNFFDKIGRLFISLIIFCLGGWAIYPYIELDMARDQIDWATETGIGIGTIGLLFLTLLLIYAVLDA